MRRVRALLDNSPLHLACLLSVGVLIIVFLFQTLHHSVQLGGVDLTDRLNAANLLLRGDSPYENLNPTFPYVYPLFLAFSLIPLTLVPYEAASIIWYLISAASLAGVLKITTDLARAEFSVPVVDRRRLVIPTTLVLVLSVPWIQNHFLNGQVTITDLLFCMLFYRSYMRGDRVLAGLYLGLGIAFKIFPAILLLFLLLRRRFDIIAIAIGFTLLFCLAPGVLLNDGVFHAYRQYYEIFIGPLFSRLPGRFTPAGFFLYFVDLPRGFPPRIVSIASAALVVGTLIFLELRVKRSVSREENLWMFPLYLIAVPLLSPLSEVAYLSFTLPATLLLVLRFVFVKGALQKTTSILLGVSVAGLLIARSLAHTLSGMLGPDDRIGPLFFPAMVCLAIAVVGVYLSASSTERRVGGPA